MSSSSLPKYYDQSKLVTLPCNLFQLTPRTYLIKYLYVNLSSYLTEIDENLNLSSFRLKYIYKSRKTLPCNIQVNTWHPSNKAYFSHWWLKFIQFGNLSFSSLVSHFFLYGDLIFLPTFVCWKVRDFQHFLATKLCNFWKFSMKELQGFQHFNILTFECSECSDRSLVGKPLYNSFI
jgi:hypothetical protein